MNNKRKSLRLAGLTIFTLFIVLASCKKDDPTKAVITVLDASQIPVEGATVTLWQDTAVNQVNGVQSNVRITKQSDAAGRAEFEFKLEAFLNVEAIKAPDTGRSFVRLKEHETVSVIVNL